MEKMSARLLIESGANVNSDTNFSGLTALFLAASNNKVNCMDIMLAAGAYVNVQTYERVTPLMSAATFCHKECVKNVDRCRS